MNLTRVGQRLFHTSDQKLYLHQMHQDQVATSPDPTKTSLLEDGQTVHVWASTEHTKVQGLYVRDRLFTSQGHLSLDEKMVHRQIEMRNDSISNKGREEAKETAHMEHDGLIVAGAILRFFHGDDQDID